MVKKLLLSTERFHHYNGRLSACTHMQTGLITIGCFVSNGCLRLDLLLYNKHSVLVCNY